MLFGFDVYFSLTSCALYGAGWGVDGGRVGFMYDNMHNEVG
jgi:hypothetical protein